MATNRTLTILDVEYYGDNTVHKYGIDKAYSEFQNFLDAHNSITKDLYADVVSGETAEPRHRFGGAETIDMEDIELEMGMADVQSVEFNTYELGLPLKKFGISAAWTERYLQVESVERFNAQLVAALDADVRKMRLEVGRALFKKDNYTYYDRYYKNLPLTVRGLINADGTPIPMASDGTTFDGSVHTHYMVIDAVSDTNNLAIQTNLMEHSPSGGRPVFYVHRNVANTFFSLASAGTLKKFKSLVDGRIILSALADRLSDAAPKLDLYNINDRQIGIIEDGPEVWVKPWMPDGYIFATDVSKPQPLVARRDPIEPSALRLIEPMNLHPKLKARSVERVIGFGVINRLNGVIAKIDGALGAYTAPAIYA